MFLDLTIRCRCTVVPMSSGLTSDFYDSVVDVLYNLLPLYLYLPLIGVLCNVYGPVSDQDCDGSISAYNALYLSVLTRCASL